MSAALCASVSFFGHGKGNYLFWIVQEKSGKFNFSALEVVFKMREQFQIYRFDYTWINLH